MQESLQDLLMSNSKNKKNQMLQLANCSIFKNEDFTNL